MIYGLYHSAAGLMTNEYRQTVIANNLANAETPGFKPELAVFAERFRASEAGIRDNPTDARMERLSGGLWLGRTHTDFRDGALIRTENPLDVALQGRGFLSVRAEGQALLTRDGRMILDEQGRLVLAADGAAVLGDGGTPIMVPRTDRPVSIDERGRIHQAGAVVGRLGLIDVDDHRTLVKAGRGRYLAPDTGRVASDAIVQSGYYEASGVAPVPTLVEMIEASRAYQINAQMLSLQDQTAGRLINEVARV